MNRIHDIDATLRSLDPADPHVDPASARARSDLHAILATDPTSHPRRRPWPSTRRVVLVGGMVAAATVALVTLPSLTGGDQAFATWAAAPEGMSAQQRAEAATDCRKNQKDGAGAEYAGDLSRADLVIAERRGVWTTVVLAGTDGFRALCIADDSARLFTDAMIGSIGTATDRAAPEPRELLATDLGVGTINAGDISLAAGAAGSDVVRVVYHSRTRGDVTATVNQGHFALWFPGDELMDASSDGVEVEVTYRDATTATSRLTL
jgi:hypothetical protein